MNHKTLSKNFSTNVSESKKRIVNKTLSQSFSTSEGELKHSIVKKTSSWNCSADKEELYFMEKEKSECANKEQKYAQYEVTYDVANYFNNFNVFECGRNLLDRLDVSYERACRAIQSTISDFAYFDSEEQVDSKSKLGELVYATSNSEEQIDAVSKEKSYRDYIFKNEFETMNVFKKENNPGSQINTDSGINHDSQINYDYRINSPIQINSLI